MRTATVDRSCDPYTHLAPLFVELAGLTPGDPRRTGVRDRLITGHLPMARNLARKYSRRGELLADLEQVACEALVQAVDRFQPERGTAFLPYAIRCITGCLLRHYRDRVTPMRVPRASWDLRYRVRAAVDRLTQQLGRRPTPVEVAAAVHADVGPVTLAMRGGLGECGSLDEPRWEGTDLDHQASLGVTDARLSVVPARATLHALIAPLDQQERLLLRLRFVEDLTQVEIGRRMGVSQFQVSRMLTTVLARLRTQLDDEQADRAA